MGVLFAYSRDATMTALMIATIVIYVIIVVLGILAAFEPYLERHFRQSRRQSTAQGAMKPFPADSYKTRSQRTSRISAAIRVKPANRLCSIRGWLDEGEQILQDRRVDHPNGRATFVAFQFRIRP